jgi:nitrous oxide reductase accessory protein NosL
MRAASIVVLSALLAACAPSKPVNVTVGEACWRCRRPILDTAIAAELMDSNGFASKFRTVHCMTTWIAQQKGPVDGHLWVTDYARHRWIRAERAVYVRAVIDPRTMERDFLAFGDKEAATEAARKNASTVVPWTDVLALGRTHPLGGN